MHWYYAAQGMQSAPFEEAELHELVRAGVIRPDTLVWHDGLDTWTPFSQIELTTAPPAMPALGVASGSGFCAECGRVFPSTELVALGPTFTCAACKPRHLQRLREGGRALLQMRYGGFWIRFVARLIDGVALSVVGWIIELPFLFLIPSRIQNPTELPTRMLGVLGLVALLNLVVAVAYEAYFLTTRGATPGKMAFGLKVIRTDGEKISKGLAIGRHFATYVSSMTLSIGYIMAAFDDEKRALHDRICDTRVVFGN